MKRTIAIVVVLAAVLIPEAAMAVTRVAARFNTFELYGGWFTPVGNYSRFWGEKWVDLFQVGGSNPKVNGSDYFRDGLMFGFSYGQLRNDHFLYMLGFHYSDVELKDTVTIRFDQDIAEWQPPKGFGINLYDIDFDFNYLTNNPVKTGWTPYVGAGFQAGMITYSYDGTDPATGHSYASEGQIVFGMRLNFGVDVSIAKMESGRATLALSSRNSYDLFGSPDRPRNLNLGLGLKYYFRP